MCFYVFVDTDTDTVNVFIDTKSNDFQVYYIVFARDLIVSFFLRHRKRYTRW